MLTFLLGSDDFSKKQYVNDLAVKEKAQIEFLVAPEKLEVGQLISQDLFSGKKLFVLIDAIKLLDSEIAEQLVGSKNSIVVMEEKLDKRLSVTKQLLANKQIITKEFILPHGKELNTWIEKRVASYKGVIAKDAIELLAQRVGRDNGLEIKFGGKIVEVKEIFSLWQVDGEIKKLLAYAGDRAILVGDVAELVVENQETDSLDIVNAIAEKNKDQVFNLVNRFMAEGSGSDDKSKIIQLNALLAEQFRSIALIQSFTEQHVPEAVILEKTSWKSGRLFMVNKVAVRFQSKKVLDLLSKLDSLDTELKSSTTPPRVLLDLILAQLLA